MNLPSNKRTLAELNGLSQPEFTQAVGPIFEHSPWIAAEASGERPFSSVESLHEACCHVVRSATLEKRLELIRAHPDLVGRAALAGTLTSASTAEQSGAGLDRLTPAEIAAFQNFNQRYREKFGFPFVICARLNRKEAILAAFPKRLQHSLEAEIASALEEIYKIANLRLRDIVSE
jgi:OHCU decarboxylase